MKIEQVRKLKPLDRLCYFVQERESIRLKKEAGEMAPWTTDEILQRYRFCNVRRMDDKVSRWLLENWYKPNFGHPNILLACALARFINKPESLEQIGFPLQWEPERIKKVLRSYRDWGNTVFNGAYMVRGNDGMDKIECVVDWYVAPLRKMKIVTDTMQGCWNVVLASYGLGSFMAGQIVADLRWAVPGEWDDRLTWAPMGPGSKRGMNRLRGRDSNAPLRQEQFLGELQQLMEIFKRQLPPKMMNRLEAIDAQNTLCEIDKYSRALLGEGKPKQIYRSAV